MICGTQSSTSDNLSTNILTSYIITMYICMLTAYQWGSKQNISMMSDAGVAYKQYKIGRSTVPWGTPKALVILLNQRINDIKCILIKIYTYQFELINTCAVYLVLIYILYNKIVSYDIQYVINYNHISNIPKCITKYLHNVFQNL